MTIYDGKAVFEGVAIGKLSVYKKQEQSVKRVKTDDAEAEKKRYEEARNTAIEQLKGLYEKAVKEVGESGAEIFEAHQLMVDDEDFIESVENKLDVTSDAVKALIDVVKGLLAEASLLLFKETTGKIVVYLLVKRFQPHRNSALVERPVRRMKDLRHQMALAA